MVIPENDDGAVVVYFPRFSERSDLENHYFRARWYIPKGEGAVSKVVLGAHATITDIEKPWFMANSRCSDDHIVVDHSEADYWESLKNADMILIWKSDAYLEDGTTLLDGKKLAWVDTYDETRMEWGAYCQLHWRLMGARSKSTMLHNDHEKFKRLVRRHASGVDYAVVLGTGPSIEKAFQYDFSNGVAVICNSAVKDRRLIEHVRPTFVTAGDAVSHFGVSRYAERFRDDLAYALKRWDMYLLSTAMYGYLFRLHYPELRGRILLCEQDSRGPVVDLWSRWVLPYLDSTLNVHMLPIATTFADRVYLLGVDGRRPDGRRNEDFWGHSARAQYHELVETGHLAHPVFDIKRQCVTEKWFRESTMYSMAFGERKGKQYIALADSYTPAVKVRTARIDPGSIDPVSGLRTIPGIA